MSQGRAGTHSAMIPAAVIEMLLNAAVRDLEDAFVRIDAGKRNTHSCTNCLHCKVSPSPAAMDDETAKFEDRLPSTNCAKGRWLMPVVYKDHVEGKVRELRNRIDCPDFEGSK
jgi:hypothetical protein